MLSPERKAELESEAQRVLKKYNPLTIEDLENIAIQEYGVIKVVRNPLVWPSRVDLLKDGGLSIEYFAFFLPYLRLTLGHEIGHIAAGQFNRPRPTDINARRAEEAEADYFTLCLNRVPLEYLDVCRHNEILIADRVLPEKEY